MYNIANADHTNDHLQDDPNLASVNGPTPGDNQQKVDQEKPPTMHQRDTRQGEAYRQASAIPVANPPKSANASAVPKNEEDPEAIWNLLNQLNQRAQDAGSQRLAEPAMKSSEPSYGAGDSKREASQTASHLNSTPADGPISNAPDDRTSSTQTYQDPNSPEGRRSMIRAIGAQDQAALEQWIQAGGNALKTVGKGQSAMALALTHWSKGAQMLANRLPSDATANPDKQGNTEIHLAI